MKRPPQELLNEYSCPPITSSWGYPEDNLSSNRMVTLPLPYPSKSKRYLENILGSILESTGYVLTSLQNKKIIQVIIIKNLHTFNNISGRCILITNYSTRLEFFIVFYKYF